MGGVELVSLYYDPQNNYMVNDDGAIVYSIFKLIRPSDLRLFKTNKRDVMIINRAGDFIELIHPNKYEIGLDWRLEHNRERVKYRTQK